MFTFEIQVRNNRTGEWRHRAFVDGADNPNQALKAYGVSGTRPYNGEATSRSGKRFRAIEAD
jgi:hypothetical protein